MNAHKRNIYWLPYRLTFFVSKNHTPFGTKNPARKEDTAMLVDVYLALHKHKIELNICSIICDVMFTITKDMIFNDASIMLNCLVAYC